MKFKILNKVFGSGSAPARDRFAFLALVKDIDSFPKTDSLGVLLLDDIKMKENCGMMQIYLTASTQEYSYETVGESDSKSFKVKFIGSHPGTEQQALEFATNFTEEEFVVLIPQCNKGIKVLGSPDSPLIFTSSHKSVKDSEKFNFVFEQEIGSEHIYLMYDGIITLNTNIDIDMKDFLELLKGYIKIDGSNLTDAQKQNLRTILGAGGGNIGNSDLSLDGNRGFNLKTFFLNFFSNVGLAKVGINKSNPTQALDVVGNIKTDGLIIAEGGTPNEIGSVKRNGNEIQFLTSVGWETIMLKGDYISDSNGVISPDTAVPVGGWKIGWYTPNLSSASPGTNYPNQDNKKAIEKHFTEFYFNGTSWESVSRKMPDSKDFIPLFSESVFPLISTTEAPIQRIYNNSFWMLTPGETASSSDIPSNNSPIWLPIGGGVENIKTVLKTFLEPGPSGTVWEEIDITGFVYSDNQYINTSIGASSNSSFDNGAIQMEDLAGWDKIKIEGDFTGVSDIAWVLGVNNTSAVYNQLLSGVQNNPSYEFNINFTNYEYYTFSRRKGNTKIYRGKVLDGSPEDDAVINYINSKIPTDLPKQFNFNVLKDVKSFAIGDFTSSSTNNISGGILNLTTSGLTQFDWHTLHENSDLEMIYKENSVSNSYIGFKSQNPNNKYSILAKYHTSGANNGKLEIATDTLTNIVFSSDVNTSYNIGDILKMSLKRVKLKYTITLYNLTKGWKVSQELQCQPTGIPAVAHNQSKPAIQLQSGSLSVYSYKFTIFGKYEKMFAGDSITMGSIATEQDKRYAALISGEVLVSGGGSDTTQSVKNRIYEITSTNPKTFYSNIGGNDILYSVPTATWQQNLRDIRNSLTSAGIEFVWLFTTPRPGANQINDFIKTEPMFVTDLKIDINTPLRSGSNSELINPIYDAGDNLHLNDLAHQKASEEINKVG